MYTRTRLLLGLTALAGFIATAGESRPTLAARKLQGPRYLALASDRPGGSGGLDVYLHDRLTGRMVPLPGANSRHDDVRPVLGQGAALLGFTSHRENPAGNAFLYEVFAQRMMDIPGLDRDAEATDPAFSADGQVFAFGRSDAAAGKGLAGSDLVVFSRSLGRYLTPLRLNDQPGSRSDVAVSPDGTWFGYVYRRENPAVPGTLVIHDLANETSQTVPAHGMPGECAHPSLSRDGRVIAFASRPTDDPKAWDIYVYDRVAHRLLPTPGLNSQEADERATLSADGRFLALESRRSGNWDVLLYDLKRRAFVDLQGVNSSGVDRHPALSQE